MPNPMTHPLAALIAGVKPACVYENMDPPRTTVWLDEVLAALEAAPVPDLTDSVTVHANMLRGTIVKPTVDQIIHLYGREAFQPMIDAAVAKALEDACLAVSEHADWPEDEHGRTEQAGLFARVINAICAIAPAAPHVKETPKREHDAGDVLSAPDLGEARKRAAYIANECLQAAKALEETNTFQTGQAVYRDASAQITALIALATAQAAQIAFNATDGQRLLRKIDVMGVCDDPNLCFDSEVSVARCGPCAAKIAARDGVTLNEYTRSNPQAMRLRRELTAAATALAAERAKTAKLVEAVERWADHDGESGYETVVRDVLRAIAAITEAGK